MDDEEAGGHVVGPVLVQLVDAADQRPRSDPQDPRSAISRRASSIEYGSTSIPTQEVSGNRSAICTTAQPPPHPTSSTPAALLEPRSEAG